MPSILRRPTIPKKFGHEAYPYLANFAGAYLMQQDYDIHGNGPKEVLASYRERETADVVARLRTDISSFLEKNITSTEAEIAQQYQNLFYPGEAFEGWCGKTTKQWLQELYTDLLSPPSDDRR